MGIGVGIGMGVGDRGRNESESRLRQPKLTAKLRTRNVVSIQPALTYDARSRISERLGFLTRTTGCSKF